MSARLNEQALLEHTEAIARVVEGLLLSDVIRVFASVVASSIAVYAVQNDLSDGQLAAVAEIAAIEVAEMIEAGVPDITANKRRRVRDGLS